MVELWKTRLGRGALCLLLLTFIVDARILPAFAVDEPILTVAPQRIDFGILRNAEDVRILHIQNTSEVPLNWTAKPEEKWLRINKRAGTLNRAETTIILSISADSLSAGVHRTNLVITSTVGRKSIAVSVQIQPRVDEGGARSVEYLEITARSTVLAVKAKMLFTAGIRYSDGALEDVTDKVRWTSRDRRIAQFAENGELVGISAGTTTVTAHLGSLVSNDQSVTVKAHSAFLLQAYPDIFMMGNVERGASKEDTLKIRDIGSDALEWTVTADVPWITLKGIAKEADKTKEQRSFMNRLFSIGGIHENPSIPEDQSNGSLEIIKGSGRADIVVTVDTAGLQDGDYRGAITIHSNGGDERVPVTVKIVSLQSIHISPVDVVIGKGKKRPFRAYGIWSDGTRTNITDHPGSQWIVSDRRIGEFPRNRPIFAAREIGSVEVFLLNGSVISNMAIVNVQDSISYPVLLLSPREINLGKIGPGESSEGSVMIKNIGSGSLAWSLVKPSGWDSGDDSMLADTMRSGAQTLQVNLQSLVQQESDWDPDEQHSPVKLTFRAGADSVSYRRDFPKGDHRIRLDVDSDDGRRTCFVSFALTEESSRPLISVWPSGLDAGTVEANRQVLQKIAVKNAGKSELTWKAFVQGQRKSFKGVPIRKGRYLSFRNDAIPDGEEYTVPDKLKDVFFLEGRWRSREGCPESLNEEGRMNLSFQGRSITVFLRKGPMAGIATITIDGTLLETIDLLAGEVESLPVALFDEMEDGRHELLLTADNGAVLIEGVHIISSLVSATAKDWIKLYPEGGTTKNETDYITVTINTKNLKPDIFAENIIISSDGGDKIIPLSLEIIKTALEFIPVYRYRKGDQMLLVPLPDLDTYRQTDDMKYEGIAFQLYGRNAAGTTPLYQWRNQSLNDVFYSVDRSAGEKLLGYVFSGTVGNIATVKLRSATPLYQLRHSVTGIHFYSIDAKGEGMTARDYRYDGIVGYVR
ncbi:MAG: Ig-like domain-containing protein [Deltaproteobacteria bacterium]|nr:Ig-like domain-containing protein [Deltaproteobacteria bacterium]